MRLLLLKIGVFVGAVFLLVAGATSANAATLRLTPPTGTFAIGSTFDVSIFLNTQGQTINALDIILRFSPAQLQVVSPTTGRSIIDVWASQPSFNNATGEIRLQGGTPGGINTSQGLISTITFRARQIGPTALRFDDNSRVLLHDGKGTDILRDVQGALYQIALPPPAGPLVVSETHPDQTKWHSIPNAVLHWEPVAGATAYSYVLNREPVDIPDAIAESDRTNVTYRNLADGQHYFHIRAMRDGVWGGITNFAINIDTTPPANFPIEIIPSSRTVRRQPVIQWRTTDVLSGIHRYELALIPLSPPETANAANKPFFIEAGSPHIPHQLPLGAYDVIVRAYDNAGNYREAAKRLHIVAAAFSFTDETGLIISSRVTVPWIWIWGIGIFLLAGLGFVAYRLKISHSTIWKRLAKKEFPEQIKADLSELKKYREKYGKLITILILTGSLFFAGAAAPSLAQQLEFGPPIVTSVSRDISNEDIFYVGGKTEVADAEVLIYLQNLRTGEAQRFSANSDMRGDWFYRHHTFLSPGDYLIWTQSALGDSLSPPGPQTQMTVRQTALQFGPNRISFEALYLVSALLLFAALAALTAYSIFHAVHLKRKEALLLKETREAEEALRRGFAVLRRDVEAELAVIKKARLSKKLAAEEKEKEQELLRDLDKIEAYIGKEIWDIEKAERGA